MTIITDNSNTISARILFNLLSEYQYNSIQDFQKKNKLIVDGYFGIKSYEALYKKVLKIEELSFTDYHYTTYPKKQIIWHHSAGWDNARGMFSSWQRDSRGRVATAVGITDDGTIFRGFDEKYWASAIGCKSNIFKEYGVKPIMKQYKSGGWYIANNELLDMAAIQIEICNAGKLEKKKSKIVSWFNWEVPKDKIIELNYKGAKYYERYTDEEIKSLKYWTILMGIRFNIPIYYYDEDMWTVNKKALSGTPGIYTHNSFRGDKSDVSPQVHLIEMGESLNKYMI